MNAGNLAAIQAAGQTGTDYKVVGAVPTQLQELTEASDTQILSLQSQGCRPRPGAALVPRSPRQAHSCLEPDSRLPEEYFGLRSEDEQDSTGAQG